MNTNSSPAWLNLYVLGSWTLAVLPDTQVYSLRTPGLFLTQTSWLAQQAEAIDLKYVLQLGKIVNSNHFFEAGGKKWIVLCLE